MKLEASDFETVKKILDGVALIANLAKSGTSYDDALEMHGDDYDSQIGLVYAVKGISDFVGPYGMKASGTEFSLIERVSDASKKLLEGMNNTDEPFAELSGAYLKILDDAAGDYRNQLEWIVKKALPMDKLDAYAPALQIANATESILKPERLAELLDRIKKGINAKDLRADLREHPYKTWQKLRS